MSADNAIAILRTRRSIGEGADSHYEYRLAEYGVSGEPFDRKQATQVSEDKGLFSLPERVLRESGSQDVAAYEEATRVVDGFVEIVFHDAQYFVSMFANSKVFTNERDAVAEAVRIEQDEEHYVEYGHERVFVDTSWKDLLAQADIVRQRRLTCKVLGPNARPLNGRLDFQNLGNPGIEDKLKAWGWSEDVIAATMKKVEAMYWDWRTHREAENLRLAREDNAAEMERYQRSKDRGCCQSHDESFVVDAEFEGEVRVHFGFNYGH